MGRLAQEDRLAKLERLREAGIDPYPARPKVGESAADLRARAEGGAEDEAALAGRLTGRRGHGGLVFLDVLDVTGKMQVVVEKDGVADAATWDLLDMLDLGDWVWACGRLGKTQRGEPTLFATDVALMAKAVAPPPEKWHGMTDPDLRYRRRYVDLWATDGVADVFRARAAVIRAVRDVLDGRGFLEVETPVLHRTAGGAAARPFITHHNALDTDPVLRIALELHLKRCLVGGLDRVYEMGRVFRNEGLSRRHNPEFTMLEAYQAWTDLDGIMELTQAIFTAAGAAAAEHVGDDATTFAAPFERARYLDLYDEFVGPVPEDDAALSALAEMHEVDLDGPRGPKSFWTLFHDLFENCVEENLTGPVFVTDWPVALCPLAKVSPDNPQIAERFELFIQGMELANAFTELNDPAEQEARMAAQVAAAESDEGPTEMDWEFVEALEHGMPPAGGLGIGIDRLVMVLCGADSIRDVLLFPQLRPQAD